MATGRVGRRFFSLGEARELLPTVKRLTAEAVRDAEALAMQQQQTDDTDPAHQHLSAEIEGVVARWTQKMQDMSLEVKGLWLVDFDNGEGYYCWCYPEESVSHYHGYKDGFPGRLRIM
jgi:hypothetical protein